MKATLTFDLPDDRDAFDAAFRGAEWRALCLALDARMRDMCKHGDPSDETRSALDELRDMVTETMAADGLVR